MLYTHRALQLQAYMPAGLAILLALGFCGLFVALAVLIGPRASSPDKLKPFECGSEPIGSPRGRYSVKFYQVAFTLTDLTTNEIVWSGSHERKKLIVQSTLGW